MAFQPGAFQVGAFQMGTSGAGDGPDAQIITSTAVILKPVNCIMAGTMVRAGKLTRSQWAHAFNEKK